MNKKQRIFIIIIILLLVLGAAILFGLFRRTTSSESRKLPVTASFYPMAEFARQVGGDKVTVKTLVAPGVEPHDFDPKPQDIADLYQSEVFIYNGAGLEKWADDLAAGMRRQNALAVDASAGVGNGENPHTWLDPVFAQTQVRNIAQGLIAADPQNAAFYEQRAQSYTGKLAELDRQYQDGLAACASRDIVTSHDAFAYPANRYRIQAAPIAGLSPEDEPSPQKMASITQLVRDRGVKYIFFETMATPKLAETIARETGAKTLVLNPIEGLNDAEEAAGEDYLSLQKDNLQNLRVALDCK